jgi:hypothetical protein
MLSGVTANRLPAFRGPTALGLPLLRRRDASEVLGILDQTSGWVLSWSISKTARFAAQIADLAERRGCKS